MGRSQDISKEKKVTILVLLKNTELSMREIARRCDVSVMTVSKCKNDPVYSTSDAIRVGKSGRKKASTTSEDRILVRNLRRNPLATAAQLQNEWNSYGVRVSTRTVCRRLNQLGCRSVKARRVPKLTPAMKRKRLAFALLHREWTQDQWNKVCFSDESTFECRYAERPRIWQTIGSPPPTRPRTKHPTKAMVWGMISCKGPSSLHVRDGIMNSEKYLDVIRNSAIPQIKKWFPRSKDFIFMQDGAPCHTAKIVKTYLETKKVPMLPWPGNSPDLNPIENIWALVKDRLSRQTITTKEGLVAELNRVWLQDVGLTVTIKNVIESMPRRIDAVIKAK